MESNRKADEYRQWMIKLNKYYPNYSSQINKVTQRSINKLTQRAIKIQNPINKQELGNLFIKKYTKYTKFYETLCKKLEEHLQELEELEKNNNEDNTWKKTWIKEEIFKIMKYIIRFYNKIYKIIAKNNNKDKVGPRNTNRYKQSIYIQEVELIKKSLIEKLNEFSFEQLCDYIALKRQMIEFLKLSYTNDYSSFDYFGKKRIHDRNGIKSPFIPSKAQHLVNRFGFSNKQIKYKNIDLTEYEIKLKENKNTKEKKLSALWLHTLPEVIPKLFKIMNELYDDLLRKTHTNDIKNIRKIIAKLYWLYMQTCPYYRGSASIGEILFSVLLQKYLGCDFKISSGWNKNPETIPDIHALSYDLKDFIKIFYSQFTTCEVDNVNNNNNNKNNNNNNKNNNNNNKNNNNNNKN